jgi:hypothetical protein
MRYTIEEKELVISEWKASGLSRTAFAKANRIGLQTLLNWTSPDKDEAAVEIPLERAYEAEGNEYVIIEKRGMVIRVPAEAGDKLLPIVIKAMGALS